jgi:ribosomal protein S27E
MEDAMNGTFLLIVIFLVVVVPNVAALFIRRQIRAKGKFGLGPLKIVCPNCRSPQPFFREPNSFKQMMFGGYTCEACGTEIDKYGRAQEA